MKIDERFSAAGLACVLLGILGTPNLVLCQQAQAPATDVTALAKTSQNPVGNLIAVPFQFNFNTAGDLEDETFLNVNFQPVIPFKLTDRWNVVARTIVPLDSVPGPRGTRFSGVGDIQEQVYITPANPGSFVWGAGPMFSFPTSTIAPLQTGSWAMGPGAVILKTAGPWVVGGLFNFFWTFSDEGSATEFNYFVTQPFVNYNFGEGWALVFAPIITDNFDADEDDAWTVPLGFGIARTVVFDRKPMQFGVQYYTNVEFPEGSAGQQLRFQVSYLFPRVK